MKCFLSMMFGTLLAGTCVSCAADTPTNACPAATALTDAPWWQFGVGKYRARRDGDAIYVTATGDSPTAGHRVRLAQQPMKIFPPKFALYRKTPEGMAAQVITPFSVCVNFKTSVKVEFVTVRDSKGEHRVAVEQ